MWALRSKSNALAMNCLYILRCTSLQFLKPSGRMGGGKVIDSIYSVLNSRLRAMPKLTAEQNALPTNILAHVRYSDSLSHARCGEMHTSTTVCLKFVQAIEPGIAQPCNCPPSLSLPLPIPWRCEDMF